MKSYLLKISIFSLLISAPLFSQKPGGTPGTGGGGGGGTSPTASNVGAFSVPGADGCITPTVNGSSLEYPFSKTCLEALGFTWSGTHVYTPSTTQAITGVGVAILANANNVSVDPDGSYTLTVTPTIANGSAGQLLRVTNVDTALSLVLQDEANLAGSNIRCGGANVTIGPRTYRDFVYSSAIGDWICGPSGVTPTGTAPVVVSAGGAISLTGSTVTSSSRHIVSTLPYHAQQTAIAFTTTVNMLKVARFTLDTQRVIKQCQIFHGTNVASSFFGFGIFSGDGSTLIYDSEPIDGNASANTWITKTGLSITLAPGSYYWAWGSNDTVVNTQGVAAGSTNALGYVLGTDMAFGTMTSWSSATGMPTSLTLTAPAAGIAYGIPLINCFAE